MRRRYTPTNVEVTMSNDIQLILPIAERLNGLTQRLMRDPRDFRSTEGPRKAYSRLPGRLWPFYRT